MSCIHNRQQRWNLSIAGPTPLGSRVEIRRFQFVFLKRSLSGGVAHPVQARLNNKKVLSFVTFRDWVWVGMEYGVLLLFLLFGPLSSVHRPVASWLACWTHTGASRTPHGGQSFHTSSSVPHPSSPVARVSSSPDFFGLRVRGYCRQCRLTLASRLAVSYPNIPRFPNIPPRISSTTTAYPARISRLYSTIQPSNSPRSHPM